MTSIHPTSIILHGTDESLQVGVTSIGYRSGLDQVPQITVGLAEPGDLIRSPILTDRPWCEVAGRTWTLRRTGRAARNLTLTMWGQPAALLDPTEPGPAVSLQGTVIDLAAQLTDNAGIPLLADPGQATTPAVTVERAADETGWVALGREVDALQDWTRHIGNTDTGRGLIVGPLGWVAGLTAPIRISETDPSVQPIDFDLVEGVDVDQITLQVLLDGWDGIFVPGQTVELIDDLPLPQGWMVDQISRGAIASPAGTVQLRRIPQPADESADEPDVVTGPAEES